MNLTDSDRDDAVFKAALKINTEILKKLSILWHIYKVTQQLPREQEHCYTDGIWNVPDQKTAWATW